MTVGSLTCCAQLQLMFGFEDVSRDSLLPLDMKSLLFYSGELVKYAIVAELYFLARTYDPVARLAYPAADLVT